MNCSACERRIGDLVEGELDGKSAATVNAHLEACAACATACAELKASVRLLRRVGEVRLPDDFTASLHRRLVAAPPPEPPGFLARLQIFFAPGLVHAAIAGAAAAAIVALGAMTLLRHSPTESASALVATAPANAPPNAISAGPVSPTFRVPAAKLAMVKIDFVAAEAVDDVSFAVALPEGLRFVSGGQELTDREFHWRGALALGSNPIPFAVRGDHAGRFTIQAHAFGHGVDASHDVILEVTKG